MWSDDDDFEDYQPPDKQSRVEKSIVNKITATAINTTLLENLSSGIHDGFSSSNSQLDFADFEIEASTLKKRNDNCVVPKIKELKRSKTKSTTQDNNTLLKYFSVAKAPDNETSALLESTSFPSGENSFQNTLLPSSNACRYFTSETVWLSPVISQMPRDLIKEPFAQKETLMSPVKSSPPSLSSSQSPRSSSSSHLYSPIKKIPNSNSLYSVEETSVVIERMDFATTNYVTRVHTVIINDDYEDRNHFSRLPPEVVELILCRLPVIDLLCNASRVCTAWNCIISNCKFMFWKKHYHRNQNQLRTCQLPTFDPSRKEFVANVVNMHRNDDIRNYLPMLIRGMKAFKPVTAPNMLDCLKRHRNFEMILALLRERFTESCFDEGVPDPNPWCVIAALVTLAENVCDVRRVVDVLTSSTSKCSVREVLECLYCLLFTLKGFANSDHFWRTDHNVFRGMHYRLYYAIYLFESGSATITNGMLATSSRGQQAPTKYGDSRGNLQMTHEQLLICNHDINGDEIVKVVAFAGTGKTSTLLKYTQMRPSKRFLLIVYNKSTADMTSRIFPGNVTCRTCHSLAFQHVGTHYRNKLTGNLRVTDVINVIEHRKGENLFTEAKFVVDAIGKFLASADDWPSLHHVATHEKADIGDGLVAIPEERRQNLSRDVAVVWKKMMDKKSSMVRMTHDGYLKAFQLQKKFNSLKEDYDVILVDEAQDLTPAVIEIIMALPQPKMLVGDPHQQLYSFRGAVNAMERIPATRTFYLTQSFRFGPEIAFVAQCCLELKHERKMLVGNSQSGTIYGEAIGQVATISRTNFELFREAVLKCCYGNDDVKAAFVGGAKNFGFDTILELHALKKSLGKSQEGERTILHNPLLKAFEKQGFVALKKYAEKTRDLELLGKIYIVEAYDDSLPMLISMLQSKLIDDLTQADIVFSTVHKAKGLEFSTVKLSNDFFDPCEPGFSNDEANMLYVAVTRAKKSLILTKTLRSFLVSLGEHHAFTVLSKTLMDNSSTTNFITCAQTKSNFKPTALTLVAKSFVLGDNTIVGGPLLPRIANKKSPVWKNIVGNASDYDDDDDDELVDDGIFQLLFVPQ